MAQQRRTQRAIDARAARGIGVAPQDGFGTSALANRVRSALTGPSTPLTPTISAERLATPVSPVTLPQTTPTPISAPEVTAPTGTIMDEMGNATIPTPETSEEKPVSGGFGSDWIKEQFRSLGTQLGTKADTATKLQDEMQLSRKTEQATRDYNTFVKAKLNHAQSLERMRMESGGTTGGNRAGLSAYELKSNANLANLAIIAQSSQGLLDAAQQTIKDKLDAQFSPIQEQIDFLTKYAQVNANDLTESEKFNLQEEADKKKTDLSNITSVADSLHQSFLQNGAPQSSYSALDKITQDYTEGKITAQQAQSQMYQAAGQYGVSLADQKTKADIKKLSSASGVEGEVSSMTQAVIENPSLFDDMTPTVRGKVIAELQANGYDTSNLGTKALSDTAIKDISQTQKALDDLDELKVLIEGQEELLGPIRGIQRFNPYSPAKKLQADVDRVRQTVGKTLEGGVLRKEDEDKYKKILATLADTPSTATYKINALIGSIQRDIENYKTLQQASGRSLDVKAGLGKKGSNTDFRSKYNY
jgi:hypothetical protein